MNGFVVPAGAIQVRNAGNPMSFATPTGTTHQLQSTVSAATSGVDLPPGVLHHPITCTGELTFDEEFFACPHAEVPITERRTKACLVHSMALLIIEEGFNFCGMTELPYDRYDK